MSDRRRVWRTLIAKADSEVARAGAEVVLAGNLLAELCASGKKLASLRSEYEQQLVAGPGEQARTGLQLNQVRGYIRHVESLELRLDSSVELASRGAKRARKAYLDAVASRNKLEKLLEREEAAGTHKALRLERIEADAFGVARHNQTEKRVGGPGEKLPRHYKN